MHRRSKLVTMFIAAFMAVFVATSCSGPQSSSAGPPLDAWAASAQAPCDGLDTTDCMLPFPDDYYSASDRALPNSIRVNIPIGALPRPSSGHLFDPSVFYGNDGFSPGSTILTHVPGISLDKSAIATQSDMGNSTAPNAPIVLIDATTGKRWPYWAELDANDPNPSEQLLMVHPATNLAEGHRYIVAMRNLRDKAGTLIRPEPLFFEVLSNKPADQLGPHARHLRAVVSQLHADGVSAAGMYMAWDFTVASTTNLSSAALYMRNTALGSLKGGVPPYQVTSVTDAVPKLAGYSARVVQGTFEVPSFLNQPGGPPGSYLNTTPSGLPSQIPGNIQSANFICEIPYAADADPSSASAPVHPAKIGIYGHGLFGNASEVLASSVPQFSNSYDYAFCATDWLGLSTADITTDAQALLDLSKFPSVVGRLMQALLDAQFLGRLLDDPAGFASNRAFENSAGTPLINPSAGLVYYGNSEGGIMGGAFTALSLDVHRSVLGVPGMDYDVLLDRSSDFSQFLPLLNSSIPDKMQQQLVFDLMQMLWDRAEADGYAEQMTSQPLPGTPSHQVLLGEAFGDHQVANIQTETEARTIGATVHQPALAPGRSPDAQPLWGLAPARGGVTGSVGSVLYIWDSGVPAPPSTDTAPSLGPDPHDTIPRSLPGFWAQMNTFFTTGIIPDPCGSSPCTAPTP